MRAPPATAPPAPQAAAPPARLAMAGHAWALAGLTAVAAALRFATLDLQSFWLDEAVTVRLVSMDLGGMLGEIPESESTPPLYYLLAWAWTNVLGTGEVGIRALSALFGTALVPILYAAASRLATHRAGLVAAALAATNPLLVWYSQEARAYALLVLLAALSLLAFAHALERPGRRELAMWATVSALAIATHYFALFVVAGEAAWLLRASARRRRVLTASAGVAAVALALLPLMLEQGSRDLANFIRGESLAVRALQVPKQYLIGFDSVGETAVASVAAALAAYGLWLAVARGDRGERRGALVGGTIALGTVLVPLLLALAGSDYLVTRNVLGAWPAFAVVLAIGFGARRAGAPGTAAATSLCVLGAAVTLVVFAHSEFQRDDWRGLAEALGETDVPRALVISPTNGTVPLDIYLEQPIREFSGDADGETVGEIAVMAVSERRPGEDPRPPRPPAVVPPGFRLAERRDAETFTMIRLRSGQPVGFVKPALRGLLLGPRSLDLSAQPVIPSPPADPRRQRPGP